MGEREWAWIGLFALGAFHGINPGMGWLFAVARGLQEGRRREVWRAMLPLAAGHALAIAVVLVAAAVLGIVIPARVLRWPVALLLLGLGGYRFFRHRHPRWSAMRVSLAELTWWSFLMATAHGAGLMVVPIFLGMTTDSAAAVARHPATHQASVALHAEPMVAVLATLVHGAGYLLVTALVAVVVFEKLGLELLRKAWINLDLVWAAALVVTAVLTVALPQ